MSDLISRGELLKRFLVNKDGHRIPERDCDNLEVAVSIKDVKTIIKEQPTAYDVDKVVEELQSDAERWEDSGKEYKDKCEIAVGRGLRIGIEIVKQGGVSDDVCEWKLEYDNLKTGCGDYFNLYDNCTDKFKFCPTCGKKIKVVE